MKKSCLICKKHFEDNTYNKCKKYCSRNCKLKNKNNSFFNKDSILKKCLICNNLFFDNSSNKIRKYCSQSCNTKAWRERNLKEVRKKSKEYLRMWRKENPIQAKSYDIKRKDSIEVKARYVLHKAIKQNPELFPKICMICNLTKSIEMHHEDYNFPLSVYPLCRTHHLEIHKKNGY